MELVDEFCLDEARETLFTLQRACERHAVALGKVVESLNSKQPEDEWLLQVLDEAVKGIAFHEQQLQLFTYFQERANAYVEAVRNEANELALQELAGVSGSEGDADADGPAAGAGAATPAADTGQRRRSSKIVHPELLKFKLEKQAKILGKYGGIPALGAGAVLPRLMKEAILKATGSPAAREIHYSKVENKEASNLAEVMRFKVRKAEEGGPNGGTPAPSPWQAELSAKKGKTALDGTDQKDQVTPSTRTHTVYGDELQGVLQQRQVVLEEALAAQRAPPTAAAAGPQISSDAMGELADKLRRRQSAAKQAAEAEAAAAAAAAAEAAEAEAAEAAAPPGTPSWSNAAAPFGGELTAALQRRAEQQRRAASGSAGGAGAGSHPETAAGSSSGGGGKGLVTPSQTRPPATASANPATGAAAGFVTPAAVRRSAPPSGLAAMMATPPAVSNELQEKLRRRLSTVDSQAPPPAPPPPAV